MSDDTNSRAQDRPGRTLCVGIDLDDLRYYRAIHGLPEGSDTPLIFEAAVPRFLQMCERLDIRATLFVIGMDMGWESAKQVLGEAVGSGHEVASHSLSHRYDLSRLDPLEIRREVGDSRRIIGDALGIEVRGFRAPGYNLSRALIEAVEEAGHAYDSSVLPAPAYYLARAGVITGMRATGKKSASIAGRAQDFFRGTRPFSWTTSGRGLAEFPITACGPGRLPLIGTSLARGGWVSNLPMRGSRNLPLVNVEFHGLDFLDIEGDGLESGLAVEPALKVPLRTRVQRFETALRDLGEGRENRVLGKMTAPA